ncbi:hypothetical protein [Microbacterium marmarense]|uniref:Uncharacterized protein n=1 Tax=Microbacterium marmarense TaxID=3122051 RepID=A0ABU8LSQ1_9MICO
MAAQAAMKHPAAGHGGRVAPLFWHRGESPAVICREIEAMHEAGVREFVLEPRPHPDYLGAQWWADVDTVLAAARDRGMRVWFFDDSHFPSGGLNGIVPNEHPHLLKRYLGEQHRDALGPAPSTTFSFGGWLREGDLLHAVVAIRHASTAATPDPDSAVDLTDRIVDGAVYWDVPDGVWRIFAIIETSHGNEARTADYLNPIAEGAAELHLATVHERHYDRYRADFGGLIAGFFQDEPRFGNERTHTFRFGAETGNDSSYVLPYSGLLGERLRTRWGSEYRQRLPLLWWGEDERPTGEARYAYMDEATQLYERFQRKLGDWCAAHRVALIGHVIEDNGAHARLGMGPGHYFRSMAGQHMGGVDVVLQQLMPGSEEGLRPAAIHSWDDEFHFWGLAKLASSAAHIDPRKNGDALCEAFGAYGWHMGLRRMKWLTDHLVVRGVNYIVPHAFSARTWDEDCPPHFHNGGMNPQWPYFGLWRAYAETITEQISGGRHLSDAAVLYHAEAEWAGRYMPFERVLRELMRYQFDGDVVPLDALIGGEVDDDGGVQVGSETYPLVIVPYAQRVPAALARFIAETELTVIFVDDFPDSVTGDADGRLLRALTERCTSVPLSELTAHVHGEVSVAPANPSLRVMRYVKDRQMQLFVVNESVSLTCEVELTVRRADMPAVVWDPMTQRRRAAHASRREDSLCLPLRLEPGESRFVSFADHHDASEPTIPDPTTAITLPTDDWTITLREWDSSTFRPVALDSLGPVNAPNRFPHFAGTIRYRHDVDLPPIPSVLDLGEVGETAEVLVNGVSVGIRIAPPYLFELPAGGPREEVTIDVTTTLAPLVASQNPFDAGVALEPTGLLGPVTLSVPISPETSDDPLR